MKKLLYIITIITAVFMVYGCEGPEGDTGPQGNRGKIGTAGEDGLPGEDGVDGEEGKGMFELEGAYDFGYITMAMEGTLDGEAFQDSVIFDMIIPTLLPDMSFMYYNEYNDVNSFEIVRINRDFTLLFDNVAELEFVYEDDEVTIDYTEFSYVHVTDEMEEIQIEAYDFEDEILPENITNYSYNESTGEVTIQFEVVVPAVDNSTGNELTVRFYVQAIAPELLNILK